MGLLRTLISALRASDPAEKKRGLAALLVAELRLYNEELEQTVAGPRLPEEVAQELVRVFEQYCQVVGSTGEDVELFIEAAADALCGGDREIILAALEGSDSGAPPPLTPK